MEYTIFEILLWLQKPKIYTIIFNKTNLVSKFFKRQWRHSVLNAKIIAVFVISV